MVVEETKVRETSLEAPSVRLSDADEVATRAVAEALRYCAEKMRLASEKDALKRLKEGHRDACAYWRYAVAKEVAEALGELDAGARAVYLYEPDATPEDIAFSEGRMSLIHLIVWAERKTAALDSAAAALERALVAEYSALSGSADLAHLLDVQVVDDAEVEKRRGYGAIIKSVQNPPIRVWQR